MHPSTKHAGRVLVYGATGALGTSIVETFRTNNWWIAAVDLHKCCHVDICIVVDPKEKFAEQCNDIVSSLDGILANDKIDVVICVAGGWAGGNIASNDFSGSADSMWKQNVWTSTIAAKLASTFMKEGGLLVLTGAKVAVEGTPGMIGYGMAKAAVHHLISSLAQPNSGMPNGSSTVGILPITLDTVANRNAMPKADFSAWTPTCIVADALLSWAKNYRRPGNGSLIIFETKEGHTEMILK